MDDNDNFTTAAESADARERDDGQPSGCEGDAGAVGERVSDDGKWTDGVEDELTKGAGV